MFYHTIIKPSKALCFSLAVIVHSVPGKLYIIQYIQQVICKTQITETAHNSSACARYLICQADNGDVVNLSRSEDACQFCLRPINDFTIVRNVIPDGAGSDHKALFLGCRRSSLRVSYIPTRIDNSRECCKTRTLLSRSVRCYSIAQ